MKDMFEYDGNELLHISKWEKIEPSLQAGFTSRNGGVSQEPFQSNNMGLHVEDNRDDVLTNRKHLANTVGIPLENWVAAQQVHHTSVHVVSATDAGMGATSTESAIKGIDGLITNEKGLLCTAFFADCVPLFFFDPVTGYIGIAHAGWKGTVGQIAKVMTEKLMELGVQVKDLLVAIGPCISQAHYEVDDYVKERVHENFREKVLTSLDNGHYLFDLKKYNVETLVQCGVIRNNIEVTNYCTFRDEPLFFSHRRDNGKTGRMLGYIGYRK